jgi:hypothetical protein
LLGRRGRSSPANASGFDPHRDSITSRLDCSSAGAAEIVLPPPSHHYPAGRNSELTEIYYDFEIGSAQ